MYKLIHANIPGSSAGLPRGTPRGDELRRSPRGELKSPAGLSARGTWLFADEAKAASSRRYRARRTNLPLTKVVASHARPPTGVGPQERETGASDAGSAHAPTGRHRTLYRRRASLRVSTALERPKTREATARRKKGPPPSTWRRVETAAFPHALRKPTTGGEAKASRAEPKNGQKKKKKSGKVHAA